MSTRNLLQKTRGREHEVTSSSRTDAFIHNGPWSACAILALEHTHTHSPRRTGSGKGRECASVSSLHGPPANRRRPSRSAPGRKWVANQRIGRRDGVTLASVEWLPPWLGGRHASNDSQPQFPQAGLAFWLALWRDGPSNGRLSVPWTQLRARCNEPSSGTWQWV